MRLQKGRLLALPTDHCPHASGRAGGFASCPAYEEVVARPARPDVPGLDLGRAPPTPVQTCAHLAVGEVDDGRFYPCCRLGPPAARRAAARTRRSAS